MLELENVKAVYCYDWDNLVESTYGRPYDCQQQDDCHPMYSYHRLTVPDEEAEDFENDSIPEVVNGDVMGVSFAAWLARDPKQPLGDDATDEIGRPAFDRSGLAIELFWARNFYPSLGIVANDLHRRGLIEAGEYIILYDW